MLLLAPVVDQNLLFRNPWYYRFFFRRGQRITACTAYALTSLSSSEQLLIYSGPVTDFRPREDGSLPELVLSEPRRGLLYTSRGELGEGGSADAVEIMRSERSGVEWQPLGQDQETFLLPGDQIVNLSLEYMRVWRPLFLLAKRSFTISSRERLEVIDLGRELGWLRRFCLRLLGSGIRVFVQPETEIQGLSVRKTRPDQPYRLELSWSEEVDGDLELTVAVVVRTIHDIRRDKSGNLLFWLHRWVVTRLSRRLEERERFWKGHDE